MTRLFVVIMIAAVLFFTACDDVDRSELYNPVLLFLLYQSTGNCVVTARSTAFGMTMYVSTASQWPRSACTDQNNYYTDANAAVNAANDELNKIIVSLNDADAAACSAEIAWAAIVKSYQTAAYITAAAEAAAAQKCAALVSGSNRTLIFCLNSAEEEAFKTNKQNVTRYTVLSDARTETSFSAGFASRQAALTANRAVNGFSESAIAGATLEDRDYYRTVYHTSNGSAYLIADAYGDYACVRSLFARDSKLKAQAVRIKGAGENYGIAAADAAGVEKAIAASSLACCSGSGCSLLLPGTPACSSGLPSGY